jgi:hypothetical protein
MHTHTERQRKRAGHLREPASKRQELEEQGVHSEEQSNCLAALCRDWRVQPLHVGMTCRSKHIASYINIKSHAASVQHTHALLPLDTTLGNVEKKCTDEIAGSKQRA